MPVPLTYSSTCCNNYGINSEQKEQTNRQTYVSYCSVSQIHMNPKKNTKNPIIMTV